MTFESWWRSKYPAYVDETIFRLLNEAWDASAIAEREECAKLCDQLSDDPMMSSEQDARYCADAIRERK